MADYPHQLIFAKKRKIISRLPTLADNPHTKTKESCATLCKKLDLIQVKCCVNIIQIIMTFVIFVHIKLNSYLD